MRTTKKQSKRRRGGWRYGIIRKTVRNKLTKKIDHLYSVHEIYNHDGRLSWTKEPVDANNSESLDGLRWALAQMVADSLRMPIYEEKGGKLVERSKGMP